MMALWRRCPSWRALVAAALRIFVSGAALLPSSIASVVPPPPVAASCGSCSDLCVSGNAPLLVPQGYQVLFCASVSVSSGSAAATASVKVAAAESVGGDGGQLQQVIWELECGDEGLFKAESLEPTLVANDGEIVLLDANLPWLSNTQCSDGSGLKMKAVASGSTDPALPLLLCGCLCVDSSGAGGGGASAVDCSEVEILDEDADNESEPPEDEEEEGVVETGGILTIIIMMVFLIIGIVIWGSMHSKERLFRKSVDAGRKYNAERYRERRERIAEAEKMKEKIIEDRKREEPAQKPEVSNTNSADDATSPGKSPGARRVLFASSVKMSEMDEHTQEKVKAVLGREWRLISQLLIPEELPDIAKKVYATDNDELNAEASISHNGSAVGASTSASGAGATGSVALGDDEIASAMYIYESLKHSGRHGRLSDVDEESLRQSQRISTTDFGNDEEGLAADLLFDSFSKKGWTLKDVMGPLAADRALDKTIKALGKIDDSLVS